jgi:uncharacterized protein (DUF302 family)
MSLEGKMSDNGLITVRSNFSVAQTVTKLVTSVTSKGMTIFAVVDHGDGAEIAGLSLRPTQLVIFGNAKGGTPLMQENQTAGIDLPLKVLVWEDSGGKVWLTYNDPAWIAQRHELGAASADAVKAMTAGLAGIVKEAAGA